MCNMHYTETEIMMSLNYTHCTNLSSMLNHTPPPKQTRFKKNTISTIEVTMGQDNAILYIVLSH